MLDHVNWGVCLVAAAGGVDLLRLGIVFDVALVPLATMPVVWPHTLFFRFHGSVAAVKVDFLKPKTVAVPNQSTQYTKNNS